jgi:hypothetical protein
MTMATSGLKDPHLLSIDRISPQGIYDKDNIRLVCWCVNKAMAHWGADLFFAMADAILERSE